MLSDDTFNQIFASMTVDSLASIALTSKAFSARVAEYALLPDVWDKMRALLQAAQDVQSAYQDVKDVHSASRVTYISGFGSSDDGAEEEELQDGEEEAEKRSIPLGQGEPHAPATHG